MQRFPTIIVSCTSVSLPFHVTFIDSIDIEYSGNNAIKYKSVKLVDLLSSKIQLKPWIA